MERFFGSAEQPAVAPNIAVQPVFACIEDVERWLSTERAFLARRNLLSSTAEAQCVREGKSW